MRETSSTLDDSRNGQCRQPRPTGFTIGGELINGQNVEVDSIGSWIRRPRGSAAQFLGIDIDVEVDSIGSWICRPNGSTAQFLGIDVDVEVDSIGSWILRPSGSVAQILGIDLEVEVDSIGSWILRPNVNSAKNSNTHNHMGC